VSEAIQRQQRFPRSSRWSQARGLCHFNGLIGAPEDNRRLGLLTNARTSTRKRPPASEAQRQLAFEEILIAEAAPGTVVRAEHHSANDREFDDSIGKHLSNIIRCWAAGRQTTCPSPSWVGPSGPPSCLRRPISSRITGDMVRYFEWIGPPVFYTADRRAGPMHGKTYFYSTRLRRN